MQTTHIALIEQIAQTAIRNIPVDDWVIIEICCKMIDSFASLEAYYFKINSSEPCYFEPDDENGENLKSVTSLFKNLREEVYNLNHNVGAWYTATLNINTDGDFNIKYNYDSNPNFEYEPDEIRFVNDFKKFPRDKNKIPHWLMEILKKHQAF